jgi:hypothetical protein
VIYVMRCTIVKADKRRFVVRKPSDYILRVSAAIMLALVPLGFIYYIIDYLVRGGK